LPVSADPAKRISVIIPALDEAAAIGAVVAHAAAGENVETLVVDGGSRDATVAAARAAGARVISAPAGRARQMNAGAAAASGELLLFLHADTRLPARWERTVRKTLAAPGVAAGAFRLGIDTRRPGVHFIARAANLRSRVLQLPYGDQAIFLRRSLFDRLGGFADLPIMEDFDLVRRLRAMGRVVTADQAVVTSARRWRRLGIVRTWVINQAVLAAFHAGLPPARIAGWYRSGSVTRRAAGRR